MDNTFVIAWDVSFRFDPEDGTPPVDFPIFPKGEYAKLTPLLVQPRQWTYGATPQYGSNIPNLVNPGTYKIWAEKMPNRSFSTSSNTLYLKGNQFIHPNSVFNNSQGSDWIGSNRCLGACFEGFAQFQPGIRSGTTDFIFDAKFQPGKMAVSSMIMESLISNVNTLIEWGDIAGWEDVCLQVIPAALDE